MTLARRTPLRRKRAQPQRIRSPRCGVRGCGQIARVFIRTSECPGPHGAACNCREEDTIGYCVKHVRAKADYLWSAKVRKGYCELADWHRSLGVQCGGPIVACHGIGRMYGATRYMLTNGFSGCSGINNWTESHPIEWEEFLRKQWGRDQYEDMRQIALTPGYKPDWVKIIEGLSA